MQRFIGRFDHSDPAGPAFAWSGSSIAMRFGGTGAKVRLKPLNPGRTNNWINIFVDDQEPFAVRVDSEREYRLAAGLADGEHSVVIVKRTEAMEGALVFLGFTLDDGRFLEPPAARPRTIEFIGDSYTCGYGNESRWIEDGYKPEQENFSITYAALTGKALDADVIAIAWSGMGMYSNYGGDTTGERMPTVYPRAVPERRDIGWDFSVAPDAVVINLGTNDFSIDVDEAAYQAAYVDFVKGIRGRYPDVPVFCTMMMPKAAPSVKAVVDSLTAQGYGGIHFVQYSDMDIAKNGIGGDWHPSAGTHGVMAEELTGAIRAALGW